MNEYVLEVKNITKTFPGVCALDDVSLSILPGTVHALVGENGAGKSTLMKILYGNYKADSGEIIIGGQHVVINSPLKAEELGISIIFQELNLIPELSVGENIYLGQLNKFRRGPRVEWKKLHAEASKVLEKVGIRTSTYRLISELSMAERQMVEIAKALSHDSKIILMDEPSATLTERELKILFGVIRHLKSKGVTFIYISHRIEEIFEICDYVTVIRDGRIICTNSVKSINRDTVIKNMVGRDMNQAFPHMDHNPGQEVMRVESITRKGFVEDVSFSLFAGEVLGIAGLVGAGRTEICRMIFAADYKDSGKIYINGKEAIINSPQEAMKYGIAYLPEERKKDGVILPFSVSMNISATNLKSIRGRFLLNRMKESNLVDEKIKKLNIKTQSPKQKVQYLSGGNQQKIVVAKWLNTKADIFIFDEPTRGIDVGTKYEIYLIINDIIRQGKSVILISSELPEVLALCNRVIIMHAGRITGELEGDAINAENAMSYMV